MLIKGQKSNCFADEDYLPLQGRRGFLLLTTVNEYNIALTHIPILKRKSEYGGRGATHTPLDYTDEEKESKNFD